MPRDDWSREEVEAIVADHFSMLEKELRGVAYEKSEHRRRLMAALRGRSRGSVEFKHQNISAILIECGVPYVAGYKPRSNYQGLLRSVVHERLSAEPTLVSLAAADAQQQVTVPSVADILSVLTDPPRPVPAASRAAERTPAYVPFGVNYFEREFRNRSIGLAGERFVIKFERERLSRSGREDLADRIEHVARERGDGAGFDVASFEISGAERLIEVKTTRCGKESPFFVSRNEVFTSEARADQYYLYRLFGFRDDPRLFTLKGALSATCVLDPVNYEARVI